MSKSLSLTVVIERKHPRLPRFVVVPSAVVRPWGLKMTTAVEGTLNGASIGRRTIKRWDDDRWFIEIPEPLCVRAKVDTGSAAALEIRVASNGLPKELQQLISNDAQARAAWNRLSPSQQRMLKEHVVAAKTAQTRLRRAAAVVRR